MVDGRRKEAWNHTSALICLIHNVLSKEQKEPSDFHPYKEKSKKKMITFDDLHNYFFKGNAVDLSGN